MGISQADASFLQTLAINGGITILLFLIFCFLRQRFRIFFAARDRRQKVPAPIPDGFFAWILPTLRLSDRDILYHHGLDVVMFQRFICSLGLCFFWMLVFSLFVLVPIDAVGSNKYRPANDSLFVEGFSILSMSNINVETSQVHLLWAHFLSVFLFSGLVMGYMFRDYRKFSRYRAFTRAFELPSNYGIMVYGLPKGIRGRGDPPDADRRLSDYFRLFFEERVKYGTTTVREPELNDLLVEFADVDKRLDRACYDLEESGKRPLMRTGKGPFGLWPPWRPKSDAITHLSTRRADILAEVAKRQASTDQQINSLGFVLFNDMLTAAEASQLNFAKNRFHFMTSPAPDPRDVAWQYLHVGHVGKLWRRIIVYTFFFFLIFFWAIPVLFAASLANLQSIATLPPFHWLQPVLDWQPALTTLVQGLLPVTVVNIFFALLLTIIRFAASFISFYQHSLLDECVRNTYFLFELFNVFLVYTIGGSILNKLSTLQDASLTTIVTLLAQSIPTQAFFFTNYVMTNSLVGFAMMLLRPIDWVIWLVVRRFLAKTAREKIDADRPPSFEYGATYARACLVAVIVLAYSTMFPLILVFGVWYFFYLYLVFRYNSAYVWVPPYEGFGQQYPFAFTSVTIGLYIYQLTMFGVLSLSRFWPAPFLLVTPVLTYMYHTACKDQFERTTTYGSLNALRGKSAVAQPVQPGLERAANFKGVEREHNKTFETNVTHQRYTLMMDLSYHADGTAADQSSAPVESRSSVRERNPYLQPERKQLVPYEERVSHLALDPQVFAEQQARAALLLQ